MNDHDLLDSFCELIDQRMIYLKHYMAEIAGFREFMLGKTKITQVLAMIQEFGMVTPDLGIWCFPRNGRMDIKPRIGDFCEIYFMNGDSSRPVYLYPLTEVSNHGFAEPTLTKDIIYEEIDDKFRIEYDKIGNKLKIGKLAINGVARLHDEVTSTSIEDSIFWQWISAVHVALQSTPANGVVAVAVPTSQKGKITTASEKVVSE